MSLKVGDKAPEFTLLDQDENKISLKNFKNKSNVVLYFYPKAMTPGCTVQACGIRDVKSQLKKLDTVVLAVSPDSVSRLVKFQEKENLNFTLLSDENNEVAQKYDVWKLKKNYGREYMGIVRTSYIIDKKGKIKHIMNKVKTKTHHDDIINILKEEN